MSIGGIKNWVWASGAAGPRPPPDGGDVVLDRGEGGQRASGGRLGGGADLWAGAVSGGVGVGEGAVVSVRIPAVHDPAELFGPVHVRAAAVHGAGVDVAVEHAGH